MDYVLGYGKVRVQSGVYELGATEAPVAGFVHFSHIGERATGRTVLAFTSTQCIDSLIDILNSVKEDLLGGQFNGTI